MNLKALYDLKERLEYSAIAGTGLLKEDFRLKRTVDNLAPLASASPVFAKISASAGKLLEASEKELYYMPLQKLIHKTENIHLWSCLI